MMYSNQLNPTAPIFVPTISELEASCIPFPFPNQNIPPNLFNINGNDLSGFIARQSMVAVSHYHNKMVNSLSEQGHPMSSPAAMYGQHPTNHNNIQNHNQFTHCNNNIPPPPPPSIAQNGTMDRDQMQRTLLRKITPNNPINTMIVLPVNPQQQPSPSTNATDNNNTNNNNQYTLNALESSAKPFLTTSLSSLSSLSSISSLSSRSQNQNNNHQTCIDTFPNPNSSPSDSASNSSDYAINCSRSSAESLSVQTPNKCNNTASNDPRQYYANIHLIKSLSTTPPPHPSTFLLAQKMLDSQLKTECKNAYLSPNTTKVNTTNPHNTNQLDNSTKSTPETRSNEHQPINGCGSMKTQAMSNEEHVHNRHSAGLNNQEIDMNSIVNTAQVHLGLEFDQFSELSAYLENVWQQVVARRVAFLRAKQRDFFHSPLYETSHGPRHKAQYHSQAPHPIRSIKDLFVPDRIIWICGAPSSGKTSVSHTVGQTFRLHHLAYIDYRSIQYNNEFGEERTSKKQYEILFSKLLHKSYKSGVVIDGFLNTAEHAFVMHFLKKKLSQIYGYIRFIVLMLNIDEDTSVERQGNSNMFTDDDTARTQYKRYISEFREIVDLLKFGAKFKFELIDATQPLDTINDIVKNQVHFQSYSANNNSHNNGNNNNNTNNGSNNGNNGGYRNHGNAGNGNGNSSNVTNTHRNGNGSTGNSPGNGAGNGSSHRGRYNNGSNVSGNNDNHKNNNGSYGNYGSYGKQS